MRFLVTVALDQQRKTCADFPQTRFTLAGTQQFVMETPYDFHTNNDINLCWLFCELQGNYHDIVEIKELPIPD